MNLSKTHEREAVMAQKNSFLGTKNRGNGNVFMLKRNKGKRYSKP